MTHTSSHPLTREPDQHVRKIAVIGFGEAGQAFVDGWDTPIPVRAYDIKTDNPDPAVRAGKRADYESSAVEGCGEIAAALAESDRVFSLVTPANAEHAATAAAPHLQPGALYLDCNSTAPSTKRRAAAIIGNAGAHFIDVAIMAPVRPRGHRTPLLVAGPHAAAALTALTDLDMDATLAGPGIGDAAAIKMIRSVMMKGLEALILECVLAARKSGVDAAVLDSLADTYPEFDWPARAAYMLERVAVHGTRRAGEMREVARTVDDLGLDSVMSAATEVWQRRIGDLALASEPGDGDDYAALADRMLAALDDHQDAPADSPRITKTEERV